MIPKEKLIVALDFPDGNVARKAIDALRDAVGVFKVGSVLFVKEGPPIIEYIKSRGGRVFLDLKFHDIPSVVANAARSAVAMGVDLLDVHATGGLRMMRECADLLRAEAARLQRSAPKVLGVTLLTSIQERELREELGVEIEVIPYVTGLARLCKLGRLDGVVASPWEIERIKEACGRDFLVVTPGIRPAWCKKGDQERVMTPAHAIAQGADYIVVGRPITQAPDPREAVEKILSSYSSQNT